MAKFILEFNAIKLKEITIDTETITIGRKEDNQVVIDNLAVSGHHARVVREGNSYIIEDLASTSGTLVNGTKVVQCELHEGDHILIGKHTLVFKKEDGVNRKASSPLVKGEGRGISTERDREFYAKNLEQMMKEEKTEEGPLGIISYILNSGEVKKVTLTKNVTIIGKGENADVKVDGLFVGKSALVIHKRSGAFYISRGDGVNSPKVNGEKIKGHIRLRDNDFIEIGYTKMHFSVKEA